MRLAGKGRIDMGYDADFTLVDPGATWCVDPIGLHDRHRLHAARRSRLRGQVMRTWVRGRNMFDRTANTMSDPGTAEVLKPA